MLANIMIKLIIESETNIFIQLLEAK